MSPLVIKLFLLTQNLLYLIEILIVIYILFIYYKKKIIVYTWFTLNACK